MTTINLNANVNRSHGAPNPTQTKMTTINSNSDVTPDPESTPNQTQMTTINSNSDVTPDPESTPNQTKMTTINFNANVTRSHSAPTPNQTKMTTINSNANVPRDRSVPTNDQTTMTTINSNADVPRDPSVLTSRPCDVHSRSVTISSNQARHIIGAKGRMLQQLNALAGRNTKVQVIGQRTDTARTLRITSTTALDCVRVLNLCLEKANGSNVPTTPGRAKLTGREGQRKYNVSGRWVLEYHVPAQRAGRLFGKRGAAFSSLQSRHPNATIKVSGAKGKDKVVYVSATLERVAEAMLSDVKRMMLHVGATKDHSQAATPTKVSVSETTGTELPVDDSPTILECKIEAEQAGRLIGRQGVALRGLKCRHPNAQIDVIGANGEGKIVRVTAAVESDAKAMLEDAQNMCVAPTVDHAAKRNGTTQRKPSFDPLHHTHVRKGPKGGEQDESGRWWKKNRDGKWVEYRQDARNHKWYTHKQFMDFFIRRLHSHSAALAKWAQAKPSKEAQAIQRKRDEIEAKAATYTGPTRALRFVNGKQQLVFIDDQGNFLGLAKRGVFTANTKT